ncbi:focadhesin-like [Watersipora subatra]|uniref:focadhesin-like n=1 Tax=Watersipora subatra TaxID=2589382 RepID=UPI00355B2CD0
MEGIRKRLEFNSELFQIQSVHALQKMVAAKLGSASTVGFKKYEVPELDFLLKLGCHENRLIAKTAQQSMHYLIAQELVDLDGCLRQLILLSSSTEIRSVLTFFTSLMNLQIERGTPATRFVNMVFMKIDNRCHPLIKVYESAPLDLWPQIADELDNSLAAVHRRESADKREMWCRALEYHKSFFVALFSDGTSINSSLLRRLFSACLSFHDYLDYTIVYLLEMLKKCKDIQNERNMHLLELLLQQANLLPGCLSESEQYSLTRFTITAISGGSARSHRLWQLLTSVIEKQETFRGYQQLLAVSIRNYLNADEIILTCILSLVRKLMDQDRCLASYILIIPLLELVSSLNLCHSSKPLLMEAEKCIALLDNSALYPSAASSSHFMVHEPFVSQLCDPELMTGFRFLEIFDGTESALSYLTSIDNMIAVGGKASSLSVYTTGALLVSTISTRVQLAAIHTFKAIVISQPEQAPGLFLLIVHWMKRSLHPDVMMAALNSLPSFALHKYNLPAVLKYLRGLIETVETRAMALRLYCDVTAVQSKAFPHLVQVIATYQSNTGDAVMVAKAKAICHICELRPALYTTELIPYLNHILTSHQTQQSIVLSLVIQSLGHLVEAEVLDIVSTWEVITSHLHDMSDRPLVVSAMCQFLALSSTLDDALYQDFRMEALDKLWSYTRDSNADVVSAAYASLAKFPFDTFKYSHLSPSVRDVYAPDYLDNQSKYDSEQVSASALVDLLDTLPPLALGGYHIFLNSLLLADVNTLGIGLSRSNAATRPVSMPKSVQKIPDVINNAYTGVKAGNLGTVLSNITAGALFCQKTSKLKDSPTAADLRLSFGSSKRTLDQLSRFIKQCTSISLSHDALFTHQLFTGWRGYIYHVLTSAIDGRKADLMLSNSSSSQTNLETLMRAREQVDAVICSSARHDTVSQCNALIAQSALSSCVRNLLSDYSVTERETPTAYLKWESNLLAGLVSVLSCKLDSKRMPWFTGVGQALSYNTAVVSLGHLSPTIYLANSELLMTVLQTLLNSLQEEVRGESPYEGFYSGQALGSILASLLNSRYQDVCSDEMAVVMDACIDFLYEHSYGDVIMEGCVHGFLELVPALLNSEACHVELVQKVFKQLVKDTPDDLAWYCRSILAANLYVSNELQREVDEEISAVLQRPMTSQIACGAGVLVSAMGQVYHPKAADWTSALSNSLRQLKESSGDDGCSSMHCYLRGLLHLTGLLNYQIGDGQLTATALTLCDELGEALQSFTDKSKGYSWMSGALFYLVSSQSVLHSRSNPRTYKRSLSTTSILRYVVERLHSHTTARQPATPDQLLLLMRCLLSGAKRKQLPLLHWSSLLTPLMRVTGVQGKEIETSCIAIAISQSKGCSLSSAYISKHCLPQHYNKLSEKSHFCMADQLDEYIDSVAAQRQRDLRDKVWLPLLNRDEPTENDLLEALLRSLKNIVENTSSHSPSSVTFAYETLGLFCYNIRSDSSFYMSAMEGVSQCLLSCEGTLMEQLLSEVKDGALRLHLATRLVGSKCSMGAVVKEIEQLIPHCDRKWLLKSTLPCWKVLASSQALDIFVKMQSAIIGSKDEQYVAAWLDILTTAVISWAKGRQQYSHLNTLLHYYVSKLMSDKLWNQLENATLSWLTSLEGSAGNAWLSNTSS